MERTRDIRKGNDIAVIWSLMKDNEPFSFQGKNLKLYLKNMYGSKVITDFTVKGNQIHWTFFGKDQATTGLYSLILVANENEVGMITTDACNFVRLVSCSCELQGGEDAPNVKTETIELTSTLEYVANVEQGGSYDDTAIRKELAKLSEKISKKQDNISDLEKIRSGAEKGATAVQPSDLKDYATNQQLTELSEKVENLPSGGNEWKCVADRRMVEGERNVEFTTYADGTPLQAKETMVQVLCDTTASKTINGYVIINSSTNKTNAFFGAFSYEDKDASTTNPLLQQIHISASPFFTIARMDVKVKATAATTSNTSVQGGDMKAFQIYEDIVKIRLYSNEAMTSAAPYLKVYAR